MSKQKGIMYEKVVIRHRPDTSLIGFPVLKLIWIMREMKMGFVHCEMWCNHNIGKQFRSDENEL